MDTNSAMVLRPTQNRTSHDRDPFRAPAPVKSQVVFVEIRPHLLREGVSTYSSSSQSFTDLLGIPQAGVHQIQLEP